MSDDAGYADFGFMNQVSGQTTQFKTPRLDQLAQQSALMTSAYISAAQCAPSRAGLITGRYQQRFGFEYNPADIVDVNDGMPLSETTIFQKFKQMGYSTGMVGKWHLGMHESQQPQNRGVDEFFGFLGGGREYYHDTNTPPVLRNGVVVNWQTEASFNNIPTGSPYGRFLTDAFGDEASKFIANHANQAEPFLLYVPLNAPHAPHGLTKPSDLAQFDGTTLSAERKRVASLVYGMDRNIGHILDRLDDPNRDGNTSDSISDNTFVIYLNDNGGDKPLFGQQLFDNTPLRGYKAENYEGGNRVPMLFRGPGIAPGVINEMVSSLDIFPTMVAAAGGVQTTPTDGVDLRPLLSGAVTGPVHESLAWRTAIAGWAVRKGDWKLVMADGATPIRLYRLNPNGSGEDVDLMAQNPQKTQEMIREFVKWEVQQDKARNSMHVHLRPNNRFDEFVQRAEISENFNWKWTSGFRNDANLSQTTTLVKSDGSPNTVLIFETRDDKSYAAENNLGGRAVSANVGPTPRGLSEFILNEVRFRGNFNGSADRSATVWGNALMLVNSLTGRAPRIGLHANRSATRDFTGIINTELVLYNDLLLTGDGTASFSINGIINNFYEPRGVTKEGSSKITFGGLNTYAGATRVIGGELRIAGVAAGLTATSKVSVENGALITMSGGLVSTQLVEEKTGGDFRLMGGRLETPMYDGSLANQGGTLARAGQAGLIGVTGNYSHTPTSTLSIRVGKGPNGSTADELMALGSIQLAGALRIEAVDLGFGAFNPATPRSFEIIAASGGVSGVFSQVFFPTIPSPGIQWSLAYEANRVLLNVTPNASMAPSADFDDDGDVDGNDFVLWQRNLGTGTTLSQGDANKDGVVTAADFEVWRSQYAEPQNVTATDADFNGDDRIDGRDFVIWQRNLGSGSTLGQGDADGNGVVNSDDLRIWKLAYNSGAGRPVSVTIPEPAGGALAGIAALVLVVRRRRGGAQQR